MRRRIFSTIKRDDMTARALAVTILAALLCSAPISARVRDLADERGATVLCYHIVESPQDPRMEISRDDFRQQMRYLAMTGYNVIPLRMAYEYAIGKRDSLPDNAVVITIDDGWRSTYTEVFPEMERRRFPFTIFIYPRIIGQTPYALSWKQVKEMADAGVDIESHSFSHPYLTRRRNGSLDDSQYAAWLQRELAESKRLLERETGHPVDFLAYPYGDYDHHLVPNVARAGYEAALTCDFGRVRRHSDPMRMKRVVIDKRMDFAAFRHYLGAGPMQIAEMTPQPGQILDAVPTVTVAAKIPNYKSLDPKSVGLGLMSMTGTIPYSYDPRDGSVSLQVKDALKGTLQRALVWATDLRTGRRVEAMWTFRLPNEGAGTDAACPPIDPQIPTVAPAAPSIVRGDGAPQTRADGIGAHRAPKQ